MSLPNQNQTDDFKKKYLDKHVNLLQKLRCYHIILLCCQTLSEYICIINKLNRCLALCNKFINSYSPNENVPEQIHIYTSIQDECESIRKVLKSEQMSVEYLRNNMKKPDKSLPINSIVKAVKEVKEVKEVKDKTNTITTPYTTPDSSYLTYKRIIGIDSETKKETKYTYYEIDIQKLSLFLPKQSDKVRFWILEPEQSNSSVYAISNPTLKSFRYYVNSTHVKTLYYTEFVRVIKKDGKLQFDLNCSSPKKDVNHTDIVKVDSFFLVSMYCVCYDRNWKTSKEKENIYATYMLHRLKMTTPFDEEAKINNKPNTKKGVKGKPNKICYRGNVVIFKSYALLPIEKFASQIPLEHSLQKSTPYETCIDIQEKQIVMYCNIDNTNAEFKNGFEQYLR